jgi:regulator of nucleoside diphosphate kinase
MPIETCTLTIKDFTILEVMRDRRLGQMDPLLAILKRKIESANVVFRDDLPENVVTLNSRATFRIDGRTPATRVISHERMASAVGMALPITTLHGLALLGLEEGQQINFINGCGVEELVLLETVDFQPESARRQKDKMKHLPVITAEKPSLKLIRGSLYDQVSSAPPTLDDFDDPGPSAA